MLETFVVSRSHPRPEAHPFLSRAMALLRNRNKVFGPIIRQRTFLSSPGFYFRTCPNKGTKWNAKIIKFIWSLLCTKDYDSVCCT